MTYTICHIDPPMWPFKYGVLRGGPWPRGTVIATAATLRGARRAARRDAKRGGHRQQGETLEVLDL